MSLVEIIAKEMEAKETWLKVESKETEVVNFKQAVAFFYKKSNPSRSNKQLSRKFGKDNHEFVRSSAQIWEDKVRTNQDLRIIHNKIVEQIKEFLPYNFEISQF